MHAPKVLEQLQGDLDRDEPDDDPLKTVRMFHLELRGERVEQVIDDVETLVEDDDAVVDVEVPADAQVEWLKLLRLPKKVGDVEDVRVQVDLISLEEEAPRQLGNLLDVDVGAPLRCKLLGDGLDRLGGGFKQGFKEAELDGLREGERDRELLYGIVCTRDTDELV